jgi:hypothetical protein
MYIKLKNSPNIAVTVRMFLKKRVTNTFLKVKLMNHLMFVLGTQFKKYFT